MGLLRPPTAEMFQGPLGALTRTIAPRVPFDPLAFDDQVLIAIGNYLGYNPYVADGETPRGANLFAAIVMDTANAAVDGSPGADKAKSNTKSKKVDGKRSGRALLIGDPGPDALISGKGPDRINARDGKPNDNVECRGSKTRVLAAKGDTVAGPN